MTPLDARRAHDIADFAISFVTRAASCDTHRNGEDATKIAAEFMSGAVDAEGSETPKTTSPPTGESV